jgi:hypothetical protein
MESIQPRSSFMDAWIKSASILEVLPPEILIQTSPLKTAMGIAGLFFEAGRRYEHNIKDKK